VYLAYVLEKEKDLKQAKMTIPQPKGPSMLFFYPTRADPLAVTFDDILTSVEATTSNERC
jgi:hypothetical protein